MLSLKNYIFLHCKVNEFKQISINSVCIRVNIHLRYAVEWCKNFFTLFEFEAGDIEKAKYNCLNATVPVSATWSFGHIEPPTWNGDLHIQTLKKNLILSLPFHRWTQTHRFE